MKPLKDQLFNEETVSILFSKIAAATPFDEKTAKERSILEFENLELKERITALTSILYDYLPKDYEQVINIFDQVVKTIDESLFVYASILEYVETYGCNDKYYKLSLSRLGTYTRAFSAEFAIRKFINLYQGETYRYVRTWARSENVDTRRLASEGTRPLLPWAVKINADYTLSIEWLSVLVHDQERYVTRSVANHLNDISKFDPELVLKTLSLWKKQRNDSEMEYIIKHSLRGLIKKGHQKTLEFIGFKNNPDVQVESISFRQDTFFIGDNVRFTLDVCFHEATRILVDYILWYQTKSGKKSKKVYKMSQKEGLKGEVFSLTSKIDLTQRTTRKIYEGPHRLEIQINGTVYESYDFIVNKR